MFRRFGISCVLSLCLIHPAYAEDTRTEEAKEAARLATSAEAPAFEHLGEGVWIVRERPELDDDGKWYRPNIRERLPEFVAEHPDLRITAITPLPPRQSSNATSTTIRNLRRAQAPGTRGNAATLQSPESTLPALRISEWLLVTEAR